VVLIPRAVNKFPRGARALTCSTTWKAF